VRIAFAGFCLLRRGCFGSSRSHGPLSREGCVLDRNAEKRVFVLLAVGGKGVLVEQYQFHVIRAGFRELWKLPSDGCDQAGLSLRASVIGHRAMRIADSEFVRVRCVRSIPRRREPRD
jgi:hypothetical protein